MATATKKTDAIADIKAVKDPAERLAKATHFLGLKYKGWKDSEGVKNKAKDLFFELADEAIASQEIARQTEQIILRPTETIEQALERRFPDMEVALDPAGNPLMEANPEDDREYVVVLQQQEKYTPFSYVHVADEQVFARGRTDGKMTLDADAWLKAVPMIVDAMLSGSGEDKASFDALTNELRAVIRQKVSFDFALDTDTSTMTYESIIQAGLAHTDYYLDEEAGAVLLARYPALRPYFLMYTVVSKPTMKLNAPRKAKKDELP